VAPSRATASSRLALFSKHFLPKPFLELNTPFSTERSAHLEDEEGRIIKKKTVPPIEESKKEAQVVKEAKTVKMSSQAPHPALMIPGPIEFDDAVLDAMSHYRYATYLIYVPLHITKASS
jgi:alanine-glyoxylate transaminase/serine-glyoxylate transaminase/serine-pyruvate transaminase